MASDEPSKHIVYSHLTPLERWRHVIEIAAFLVAAVWGFYVFVYQERIKPAMEPPVLEIRPTLSHVPISSGKELVTAAIDMHNIGSTKVQADMLLLNVYGMRFGNRVARFAPNASSTANALPLQTRNLLYSYYRSFEPFGGKTTNWFSPGRDKMVTIFFGVPQGAYEAVEVDYAFCYQRADDNSPHHFAPQRGPDSAFTETVAQINSFYATDVSCGVSAGNVSAL